MAKVSTVDVEELPSSMASPVPDDSRDCHSCAVQRAARTYSKLSDARRISRAADLPSAAFI